VELSKALHDGSVRINDVRARKDFARAHIPGSVILPAEDWPTARGLSRDQLNVVLCYSSVCLLAARAAVELAGRGYPVMELTGGFDGWKSHGLPIETGEAADETPIDRTRAFLDEARRAAREGQAKQAPATAQAPAPTPETPTTTKGEEEPRELAAKRRGKSPGRVAGA
jgi:rhodanese-related sulfurtransferase